MDWNGNLRVPSFLSRPETSSFSLLYNYYHQYPGTEMKQYPMMTETQHGVVSMMLDKNNTSTNLEKNKKRLSSEQLDALESSFQEEIKLDPDRKLKLAQDIGLHPRQVAVWFQNRRARWKAKQLERLYDSLKQELDLVSKEKLKLQQEVLALRALLKEEARKKQLMSSGNYTTDISGEGEDTVESSSVVAAIQSDRNYGTITSNNIINQNTEINDSNNIEDELQCCNYVFNVDDDYNNIPGVGAMMTSPYWGY